MKLILPASLALFTASLFAEPPNPFQDPHANLDAMPEVADGFAVTLWAKEPLVRNPCALAFDAKGRMCVGMGPQYRHPKPDTPGDSVFLVFDTDGDGTADKTKIFATGFNCIQGLAWRGADLWVANAPDLTIVRDLDGDDVADEYVRVFTDLGNLEHGLHGLNWAPDGRLYMSKGNSKGINQPGRIAPKAFRELAGVRAPNGTPDLPPPQTFRAGDYRHSYQDPNDNWGREGGVLRCEDGGVNLEIVSRGLRNPWDIAFSETFDWLGTDNDQNEGDRFFAPFADAHFGWGHAWSASWSGANHPPTAPMNGPAFPGSGTGVVWSHVPGWPATYRGCFFVNDWLLKKTYIYRPRWEGAQMLPHGNPFEPLIKGGASLFRPTELDFGHDGALYILGWGRTYDYAMKDGQPVSEGRIFRIVPVNFASSSNIQLAKRTKPVRDWTVSELSEDLAHWLPIWQTNAADELVRRGATVKDALVGLLAQTDLSQSQRTWVAWTLGRIDPGDASGDSFWSTANLKKLALPDAINAVRILGYRASKGKRAVSQTVFDMLSHPEPRFRLAAVSALRESKQGRDALVSLAAKEGDRIVFYSAWQALRDLISLDELRTMLSDPRGGIRRAALLALLESRALSADECIPFMRDEDAQMAKIAGLFLAKSGRGQTTAAPVTDDGWPLRLSPTDIQTQSGHPARLSSLRVGESAYADRGYKLVNVPEPLAGVSFIQTPNEDAGSKGEKIIDFDLPAPASVYLAHDERVPRPPAWMQVWQPSGFADSDMRLATNDAHFRVWQKDFPAGRVTLGGNTDDGTDRGKSNYLIAFKPAPLALPKKATTEHEALAALEKGDAKRGEWLFAGETGAGCWRCHRIGERGGSFGPNLTGFDERGDAAHIIRSILEPNAAVTEGFALLNVETKDGANYAGVLAEETDLTLTLKQADGAPQRIEQMNIRKRESLHVSPMPPYAAMLTPSQCADIAAYLLSQRGTSTTSSRSAKIHFRETENSLDVVAGDVVLATYLTRDTTMLRPGFSRLRTVSGRQITRNFPPTSRDKGNNDHPTMHCGLWFGFGDINGHDFWRNKGRVVHESITDRSSTYDGRATFSVLNRFVARDGTEVCQQRTRHNIRLDPKGWLLTLDTELFSETSDLYFGDQEEMGLGIRLAADLSVKGGGGEIRASHGGRNEAGTWGKTADWWNYSRVLAVPSPENPRPSWGHVHDHGLIVLNPFPRNPNAGSEIPIVRTLVKKGEPYRLRYRVLIYDDPDLDPAVEAARIWKEN